jgi:pimeloyl-ACP methyl ester carboxylesterase
MPVLVMAGEHDEKFGAIGRRMVQAMGENATFVPVPGAGHAAHLEQPEVFVELLRAWLAGVNVAKRR